MRLPNLEFHLPEWNGSDFAKLKQNREKIMQLSADSGYGSDRFKDICRALCEMAKCGEGLLPRDVKTAIEVRALTYLWGNNEEFIKCVPITVGLLAGISSLGAKLGRLTLLQLIRVFFVRFDWVGDSNTLKFLCEKIIEELSKLANPKQCGSLSTFYEYRNLLFSSEGPALVIKYAFYQSLDMNMVFEKFSLGGYHNGRFQEICRFQYFLNILKKIPVGDNDPVLSEVCNFEVYMAPGKGDRLLGHEILEILIDRADSQKVSEAWQGTILRIAGDPRVPSSSSKYQRWWVLLGDERMRKVRGWLNRFDLKLFLKVLEEYGNSSGNVALQRMFPARKTFLEGLLRQDLIRESRLFICGRAEKYLKDHYKRQELPEYALMKDSQRSMIYLQVGDFHMIEGSHNFKLWIFPKLPDAAEVTNCSCREYIPHELSSGLQVKYSDAFGKHAPSALAITHNPNITWQAKAIAHLEQLGLSLDKEELFSPEDYLRYIYKFGL